MIVPNVLRSRPPDGNELLAGNWGLRLEWIIDMLLDISTTSQEQMAESSARPDPSPYYLLSDRTFMTWRAMDRSRAACEGDAKSFCDTFT